ncbi:MAG: UvrB/UvrC protein [Bacillales bacterium]|jgi:protein arginine kinase activator|nr:UvrB/UvrC protein [Bacillales bacterium]
MLCQQCNKNNASIHFTKIVNGEKNEYHLCEVCAEENGAILSFGFNDNFSVNNLLSGLLNINQSQGYSQSNNKVNTFAIKCKKCGLAYTELSKLGRLGCSDCYKAFDNYLQPLIRRLHSGNFQHTGKVPKRGGKHISLSKKLNSLKQELKVLISNEDFENAAIVRDKIKELENQVINEGKDGNDYE